MRLHKTSNTCKDNDTKSKDVEVQVHEFPWMVENRNKKIHVVQCNVILMQKEVVTEKRVYHDALISIYDSFSNIIPILRCSRKKPRIILLTCETPVASSNVFLSSLLTSTTQYNISKCSSYMRIPVCYSRQCLEETVFIHRLLLTSRLYSSDCHPHVFNVGSLFAN